VKSEILDCNMNILGECRVLRGNILSSEINAGRGIVSVDIGTRSSKPCRLKVGASSLIEKKIETIIHEMEKNRLKIEDLKNIKEKHQDWQIVMQNVIDEVKHEKNRVKEDKESVLIMIDRYQSKKSKRALPRGEQMIQELNIKIKAADDIIDDLTSDILDYNETLKTAESDIDSIDQEIVQQDISMSHYQKWNEDNIEIPQVKVYGKILEKTAIHGKYASVILKDDYQYVTVKEITRQLRDKSFDHSMQIIRNAGK